MEGPREGEGMKGVGGHKRDGSNLADLPSNTSSQKTGMYVCQLDRHMNTLKNKKFWIYLEWL